MIYIRFPYSIFNIFLESAPQQNVPCDRQTRTNPSIKLFCCCLTLVCTADGKSGKIAFSFLLTFLYCGHNLE